MSGGEPYLLTRRVAGKATGFWSVAGEVVAVDRWTDTHVSSSGGHVLVTGQHVSVTPPKLWTNAVARKAAWVRTRDTEFELPVPDNTAVRAGHRVHVVASSVVGAAAGQWSGLVNHDTGQWHQLDRFPPGGCYGTWTGFVMGFGQGTGSLGVAIMLLYAVPGAILFGLVDASLAGLLLGFAVGGFIGFCHGIYGALKARDAVDEHKRAVRKACLTVCEAAAPPAAQRVVGST